MVENPSEQNECQKVWDAAIKWSDWARQFFYVDRKVSVEIIEKEKVGHVFDLAQDEANENAHVVNDRVFIGAINNEHENETDVS